MKNGTTTNSEWHGEERRKNDGRVVYSRGPIILALEIVAIITALFATGAFAFSFLSFSSRVTQTRQILRSVLCEAGRETHKVKQTDGFLIRVHLPGNCANVTH